MLTRQRACVAAHEMAYDALQRPQRRLHDLLARAEAEGPEEVEKPSTQRKARAWKHACARA